MFVLSRSVCAVSSEGEMISKPMAVEVRRREREDSARRVRRRTATPPIDDTRTSEASRPRASAKPFSASLCR